MCLDETTVKFEIWDTAGQERYHSLAPMYYRGAQAAIVVFDITKPVLCFWKNIPIVKYTVDFIACYKICPALFFFWIALVGNTFGQLFDKRIK